MIVIVFAVNSLLACAQEAAYAYGDLGGRPLEIGNLSEYNGTDVVTSYISSASYDGGAAWQRTLTRAENMKTEINLKLNVRNPAVIDRGCSLVLDYPGDGTISQICSIYEYMVGNWSYKRDPRGIEVFQYSNQSLEYGNGKYSGQGDCDDFSILLASLVESIGCTSRIILAYGPGGGHAYAEVYLGKAGSPESDVGRMITWLKKKYGVKEINVHTSLQNGDVWLNLDWWKDPNTGKDLTKHPGGPFFWATEQVPIWIREDIPWIPLKPMNELPIAEFSVSPLPPVVGENTSFNASSSWDIGGRVESYLWDFGDGNKTEKISEPAAIHIYSKGGLCMVNLTVWDDEGAVNISSQKIMINNPPQANFTIEPQRPKVGDLVRFDASSSLDAEDGTHLAYHWEMNNNSATFSQACPARQVYDEAGLYWINLTVSDTNGAVGHKNYLMKINRLPIARIALDSANLSLGRMINFTAGMSGDLDGEIIGYSWDFGDNSTIDHNKTAFHRYHEGGEKTVRLSVKDNDGAISNTSQSIVINHPPIAKFSLAPLEPEKGEPVSFDARESYDPDGKILRYLWDFGVGKAEPEVYYSEFAENTYHRHNKYNITLTVLDDKGATGSLSKMIEVKDVNNKPIVDILQPDRKSPQTAGSTITWTVRASDEESDPLQFLFLLDEQIMQNWSESSVWRWVITNEQVGLHRIEASVRDGKHDSEGDSSKAVDFEVIPLTLEGIATGRLTPNEPPVLTALFALIIAGADPLDAILGRPLVAENPVIWAAEASDPEEDPLQFQFSLDGQVMQDWSNSIFWNWTPTKNQAGNHIIESKVRDGNHAGSDGSDDSMSLNFSVIEPDSVDLSANSGYSYTGSTADAVYTGSSQSAPHSIISTASFSATPTSELSDTSLTGSYSGSSQSASHSIISTTSFNNTPTSELSDTSLTGSYSGSSGSASRSTIGTAQFANDKTTALAGGSLTYDSPSPCMSCGNTYETGPEAVNSSNDSTFWLKRGDELFNLGRCDEAIGAYNKSYLLDRKNAKPLFGKGRSFFAKGEYEEALIWLTAAIELSPQYKLSNSAYADIWIYRGNALRKLGRDIEADAAFDKAEDLDPTSHPELEDVVQSCAGAVTYSTDVAVSGP
ncbi:MAG: PKD domain protein [Methanosaeta sp. PtaU1.Bin112]|nr:MAG: PKD domain protein [Methanosaeta sp. PtaU1.Bin112]